MSILAARSTDPGLSAVPLRARRAPALASRRESTAAMIRRALKGEIVGMQRKPGEPINEKAIASAFGVSRTPVREALIRLAEDGLVDIFPQSGTFVARIPLAGMPEAMLVREALEATTVKIAAGKADAPQIGLLQAALAQQDLLAERGDAPGFHRADEDFHALIAATAGFPGVWSLVQQVKIQIDRFRHLTLPMPGRMVEVVAEHRRIVAAIAGHHVAAAEAAMMEHLATMRSGLSQARHLNPAYFFDDEPAAPAGAGPA